MPSDLNPLTQLELEEEGLRLSRKLTEITERMLDEGPRAGVAEHNFKIAYAKGVRSQREGTVPEKEAAAMLAAEDEHLEWKEAEGTMRILRDIATNLRTQIEWVRSMNANVREHVVHGATGRGG